MSGGHWNYQEEALREQGAKVKDVFDLLATFEHELDWGICSDTCLDCAKLRVAEALIMFFDGNVVAAQAIARDAHQNRCARCETVEKVTQLPDSMGEQLYAMHEDI